MESNAPATPIHLSHGGTSLILHIGGPALADFLYWGRELPTLDDDALSDLGRATLRQRVSGALDASTRVPLLPLESAGWQWTPGLVGSRRGEDAFPSFTLTRVDRTSSSVTITAVDHEIQLELTARLWIDHVGLVGQQLTVTNRGARGYGLESLGMTLLLPDHAGELFTTTGRHLRERHPQRHEFTVGQHLRESRRGRPGADSTLLVVAGTPGFAFESGECYGVHLAWSGNQRILAERTPAGHQFLQAGELLLPGEVVLETNQSYATPTMLASWGSGLSAFAHRFHAHLRARPGHPRSPRPVTLNTWEAVYFDQQLPTLLRLAETAAAVGTERFVLDDGWFRGRRDDTRGLGDWYVDADVWPDGLAPLVDHVTRLGMQFGLWVEPEMVNLDSELARVHPEWLLRAGERLPLPGRQQYVLDLSNPDVSSYLLARLDELLRSNDISYLKWDHNRDLLEAASTRTGRPAIHENVLALYRLLDEIRTRHPHVEIESCASGGARVDLGILDRVDRIWTSDCNDPLERLTIQRYTNLIVPYELMGAHIGPARAHSTGRETSLDLRAGVALFGHLGIEWDIRHLSAVELERLRNWVSIYKDNRAWMHTGDSVFADLPDPAMDLRGVVAPDRRCALFSYVQTASSRSHPPDNLRFPGLDDDATYTLRMLAPTDDQHTPGQTDLAWASDRVALPGLYLRTRGVPAPVLFPQQLMLIELRRSDK